MANALGYVSETKAGFEGTLAMMNLSTAIRIEKNGEKAAEGQPDWAFRNRRRDMLTVDFALRLHREMFGNVWEWAGTYRRTEKNIGIAPNRIGIETAQLIDDVRYWSDHATFEPDETAVRLHHRLVWVHPFPNGNGRHARMMADLLVQRLGNQPFSWGGQNLQDIGALRQAYVEALRRADQHDIGPLLEFARS